MTEIIEKGVPLAHRHGSSRDLATIHHLLTQMVPGDSFVTQRKPSTIYTTAYHYGFRVAIRKLDGGGFRVWLVAKEKRSSPPPLSPLQSSLSSAPQKKETPSLPQDSSPSEPVSRKAPRKGVRYAQSLQEVIDFALKKDMTERHAVYCWNHWNGNGWTNNGKPIGDWKSVMISWRENNILKP